MPTPRNKTPQHVAIIMDGNGRWARQHGLPRAKGHEKGAETVQRVVQMCLERGIPWLTLYAFSTENWGRPAAEVKRLMDMLYRFLDKNHSLLMEKNVRLRAIGELNLLPEKNLRLLNECIRNSASHTALNLTLALSYGSRQEITAAARRLAEQVQRGALQPADISPELLAAQLYTADMPDPDLLIRTSGEMRLSNYLLWQVSYAELWLTPVLWPDFAEADFDEALRDYAARHRRYGKH